MVAKRYTLSITTIIEPLRDNYTIAVYTRVQLVSKEPITVVTASYIPEEID